MGIVACLNEDNAREVRLRTSKNGRPRTLPLTGELWEVIERRWQARDFDDSDRVRFPEAG